MKKRIGLALLVASLSTAALRAETIGYRVLQSEVQVGSGTFTVSDSPPYTNITIPLGTVVNNTDVHIFTAGGGSGASVGIITLTANSVGTGIPVRVLIADQSLTDANGPTWSTIFGEPSNSLAPGLRNLGGIQFVNPLDAADFRLRDESALSVTVLGDITGPITAGKLYRIDARRSLDQTFGGTISGNLTSTNGDYTAVSGAPGLLPNSIEYVRAGWAITGNIIALAPRDGNGDPTFAANNRTTWGSIGQVIVGPSTDAPGITGNILAEYGEITDILSTGAIGVSATQRSSLRAGARLSRISTRSESSSTILNRPIFAEVNASVREIPSLDQFRQSSMSLVETEGDFVGSIKMLDFFGVNDNSGPTRPSTRKGIFVGGNFLGDIEVTYSYQYGDMIARSFRGEITIGQMLKGAIVAVGTGSTTDPLDGTINSIVVGYSTDLRNAPRPNQPGFNSTQALIPPPPFEGAARDNWYTMDNADLHTAGSVIRAEKSITTIALKAMSSRLPELGGKSARARIESPHIGDLKIENFDSGSVWSGRLNSTGTAVTNDMPDDYALVDNTTIGCMGPKADLWVQSVPLINIYGDMFGEVHMPAIEAGHALRIGGRLGDKVQAISSVALCGADVGSAITSYANVFEDSPRAVWNDVDGYLNENSVGVAEFGRILIRQTDGLEGQIILDALNSTQTPDVDSWRGDVLVGTEAGGDVYSTNPDRAPSNRVGPYYAAASSDYGAGAIGLVPFALMPQDSEPFSPCTTVPCGFVPGVTAARFASTGDGIVLRFYGPVALTTGSKVRLYAADAWGRPTGSDLSGQLTLTADGRALIVRGVTSHTLAAGRYVIEHAVTDTGLVCDQLMTPTPPVVRAFKYHFFLFGEASADASCADFDGDGDVGTDADLESFFACLAGNCCATCLGADFNCDGDSGTDADIEALFRSLAGSPGECNCN